MLKRCKGAGLLQESDAAKPDNGNTPMRQLNKAHSRVQLSPVLPIGLDYPAPARQL